MKRFLSMLLVLAIMVGTVPTALAATPEAQKGYYGNRLTDQEGKVDRAAAIAFYEALGTMNFASGENVPVTDPTVVKLAESYAGGSDTLLRSFGAAVDSFRYDHTEYFYVDWDMLSVNVGKKGNEYVVNIGTGRTDSYLRDKTKTSEDITAQISAYDAALTTMVADAQAKAGSDTSVKNLAKAANDVVCEKVTYSFCDDANGKATEESKYIRTAYGALVNGKAVCEGYARLYKAVLNELGVNCELVSGYFIDGEAFEPHMWNYVQDEEGRWYAVDVTMNDGHRLQMGGIETTYDKYFWQTYEIFAVDHFEDGIVSSVEYDMPYPELYRFWKTPTSSGLFDSGYGAYGDKSGFWFSYDGKSAEELKAEGLYMAFRTATTNTGTVRWSPWQTAEEMIRLYHSGGVVSEAHKTYLLMPNIAMSALEAGIFDIPEDAENKTESGVVVAKRYSEEAETSHLIEKITVENPTHDQDYIAPTHVRTTEPGNLLQAWMDVTKDTQHVELTFGDQLREDKDKEGNGFELTWDVSSYNRRDLSLEAVQKYAKVENVQFDGDRTISFDFTPSRMYNHNMIFYDFTINNMVNVIDDGKDGVAVPGFSIGARYEDDIACCKIFNDGRLYINSYAQPSIAMNGDLSMNDWTYKDADGTNKKISESQRSQMALVVTRPNDSEDLAAAATKEAGSGAAVRATTYEIDLNICGKVVQIPNGSYMKLNLGIPDEFADLVGKEDIKFKLYHFKRDDSTGKLDYTKTEEIECVLTPYGIIAEVNSFSPYVLVAVDNGKLPEKQKDTSKSIALVCNGHGGKVEGPAVGTLEKDETATYTLTPDQGYEVEFVRLNGTDITPNDTTKLTLEYANIQSSNTLEVGFVAKAVKEAEKEAKIENVPHATACTVTFETNGGSAVEPAYAAVGATITAPATPTKSGYHFDGWYTDHEFQHAYDFSTPVNASITLYAKWTKVSSGGSGSGSSSGSSSGSGGSTTPTPPVEPVDPPAWENPFTDVAEKDWYYSAVQFAVDNHLFYGVSDTAFSPNSNMTRGMLATVLYRLAKEPETNAGDLFNDVADGQYYTEAVAWAAGKGIVNGYGDGTFGPGNSITREQLAVMLWRYAGSPASAGTLDGFNDRDKIHAWAADALAWAVEQKIVSGRGGGILDPIGQATRAEVAAMLMRYCEAVK